MWRILFILALPTPVFAEEPTFDSIEYASPANYLVIPDTLGNEVAIAKHAATLKADSDRVTVRNVVAWMATNLAYDAERAYQWRDYDTVMEEGCYASCADQAIVCGVLLRAAGIPAVWVKTMDVSWIWDFKKQRPFQSWSGHVFLEVYLDGQWVLLDPGAATIYPDYSPRTRILPGNRFAYHKGSDPMTMIMSLQWEAWKEQTAAFFAALDEGLLPVDAASAVGLERKCFIIANAPYYQFLTAIAAQKGLAVGPSFNTDYDNYLPKTKGQIILIETHDGIPIVSLETLRRYYSSLPAGPQKGSKTIAGTTLVFVEFSKLLSDIEALADEQDGGLTSRAQSNGDVNSTVSR